MKIKQGDPRDDVELDSSGQPKTHKQIIHELIMASKQKKFEKSKEADENYELVCKLDDEFKDPEIRNLLLLGGAKEKKGGSDERPKEPASAPKERVEYDTIVRELQFETKTGRASDRLKTDFEVANEEKDKLEQLERDRLKRMQMVDTDGTIKHRSADDLDDG
jgi:nucleolar protein 14